MNPLISKYFEDIVTVPDENINLAESVLYIATIEYPELDTGHYLQQLDEMADGLGREVLTGKSVEFAIGRINDYLFRDQGFSGNWREFNDPRNSFLNDVLDRKLGIPISLSIVYMEIGRRLGLCLRGVSFPGHFLVKLCSEEEEYIIDTFSGGIILQERDLNERLEHYRDEMNSSWNLDHLLQSANNAEILARVLRNLKYIYMDLHKYEQALSFVNLQLMLEPDSMHGLRDRASIYERLDYYRSASRDFQRYLELNPEADDYQQIQSRLSELRNSIN